MDHAPVHSEPTPPASDSETDSPAAGSTTYTEGELALAFFRRTFTGEATRCPNCLGPKSPETRVHRRREDDIRCPFVGDGRDWTGLPTTGQRFSFAYLLENAQRVLKERGHQVDHDRMREVGLSLHRTDTHPPERVLAAAIWLSLAPAEQRYFRTYAEEVGL